MENTQHNSDGCFSQRDLKEKHISMLKMEMTYVSVLCVDFCGNSLAEYQTSVINRQLLSGNESNDHTIVMIL